MKPNRILVLICAGAFLLRLVVLQFVQHPGTGDPNHYYNLAHRLLDGHGFTIDYIWQFNNPPDQLEHPDDYWMPLTGVIAAVSMQFFGRGVREALIAFSLVGSLIPALAYLAARKFGCSSTGSLFAAGMAGVLPELVLNSVRTDTTIPNTFLLCACILLLMDGVQHGRVLSFLGSGVTAGLAYLIRSDSALLLPVIIIMVAIYARWGSLLLNARRLHYAMLAPMIAFFIALPWALRNIQISGTPTTPKLEYMFYFTDYLDHYVYSTQLSLQTMLSKQTPLQLVGKRLFEMAASFKLMYATLDQFAAIAIVGGLILLLRTRNRDKWLVLTPTVILLTGFFLFYTVLVPYKSQGGSFKKAYISLIPLLLPIGVYAIESVVTDSLARVGIMLLAVFFTGLNAFEYVRADARSVNAYLTNMRRVASIALSLPDTNQDNRLILFSQDPFMLRFVGIQSVMIPLEDRDTILEVARRYNIDYIIMPPARPALDPIYLDTESDPHFVRVADVPGTALRFYRINPGNSP